jgi:hypothetical protein
MIEAATDESSGEYRIALRSTFSAVRQRSSGRLYHRGRINRAFDSNPTRLGLESTSLDDISATLHTRAESSNNFTKLKMHSLRIGFYWRSRASSTGDFN